MIPFQRGGNLRKSLGTSLTGLLDRVPPDERKTIQRAVREDGFNRGIVYEDEQGKAQPTPILLRPRVLGGNQREYLHRICLFLEHAYLRLYRLWWDSEEVRAIVPVSPTEESWLRSLGRPHPRSEVLFGRFDASTDFGSPDWVRSTQFFEYNPTGAAGLHLAPTVDEVILQHVVPALRRVAPTLLLEPNDDPRRILLETLADHARFLKLKRFNVALVQGKDLPGGPAEFSHLEKWFRSMGVSAWHVDPRELRLVGQEIRYGDEPIDIVYRDHCVAELAEWEAEGADFSALKHAFKAGRCVASAAGEFDHKSAFEVFTSPEFDRYFTPPQRRAFRQHLPWTRIVSDRKTTDPEGRPIELLSWARRRREDLVIKPNRLYGGEGVHMGREAQEGDWDRWIDRAVAEPTKWVFQSYRPIAEKDFPTFDDEGNIHLDEYFTVLGLFASEQRLGILGRASRKKVVNIAQHGGVVSVLRLL